GPLDARRGTPISRARTAHKGALYPGQNPALIEDETWTAVGARLAANAGNHKHRAGAVEPSLLAGLLVDARGERLTPSHAVKKGRRYRYYVSTPLITGAGNRPGHGRGARPRGVGGARGRKR